MPLRARRNTPYALVVHPDAGQAARLVAAAAAALGDALHYETAGGLEDARAVIAFCKELGLRLAVCAVTPEPARALADSVPEPARMLILPQGEDARRAFVEVCGKVAAPVNPAGLR